MNEPVPVSRMKLRGAVESIAAQVEKIDPGARGVHAIRANEPRPGNADAAPNHDPRGDTIAAMIREILVEIVIAGMCFSAGKDGSGRNRLNKAHQKLVILRVQLGQIDRRR